MPMTGGASRSRMAASVPAEVLTQRLATRTNNPFGKSALEFRRFQADLQQVEPLLRAVADHEFDTTVPLSQVVGRS
jgi:hypothetical protein